MSRAVVFDLDGVLIDSEPVWRRVIDAHLARHGRGYDEAVAARHFGLRLRDVVAVLLDGHGIDADPAAFGDALIDDLLAEFDRGLAPMPGAPEALALAARHGPVGLASSSPRRVIDFAVARFDWEFAAVCSGDDVAHGKPAPDIYLLAARRLGVDPSSCVAIEDSPHGVAAARAAGMACVAVPGTIDSLRALRATHLLQ
jgi:HAD superfamily hydrolase (TIGR01509 family)